MNWLGPYHITRATPQCLAGDINGHCGARTGRVQADTWAFEVEEPTDPVGKHTETEAYGGVGRGILGVPSQLEHVVQAERAGVHAG